MRADLVPSARHPGRRVTLSDGTASTEKSPSTALFENATAIFVS